MAELMVRAAAMNLSTAMPTLALMANATVLADPSLGIPQT